MKDLPLLVLLRLSEASAKLPRIALNSGETLIEVIIAVSVFVIIMGAAAGMHVNSIRTTAMNRNDIQAELLADDGIEFIRNILGTNFLRFAPKAGQCWNTKLTHTNIETCDQALNKIPAGSYRVAMDPTSSALPIVLSAAADFGIAPFDANNPNAWYQIKLDDQLNFYNYHRGTDSVFFHTIQISYPDPDLMQVISTVAFRAGKDMRVFRKSNLFNSMSRE